MFSSSSQSFYNLIKETQLLNTSLKYQYISVQLTLLDHIAPSVPTLFPFSGRHAPWVPHIWLWPSKKSRFFCNLFWRRISRFGVNFWPSLRVKVGVLLSEFLYGPIRFQLSRQPFPCSMLSFCSVGCIVHGLQYVVSVWWLCTLLTLTSCTGTAFSARTVSILLEMCFHVAGKPMN